MCYPQTLSTWRIWVVHSEKIYKFLHACFSIIIEKVSKQHHCATENGRKLKMWFWEKFGDSPSFKRSIALLSHSNIITKMDEEDIAILPPEFILPYLSNAIEYIWKKLPKS